MKSSNDKILNRARLKLSLFFKKEADEEQLSLITGNLAQIYKDGIPINLALQLVADTTQNKMYRNSLYKVMEFVMEGNSLSEAFGRFNELYPKIFTGIISIGENTGKLYEVLKGLNIYYHKSTHIKREIKSASAYPLLIIASIILLGIFFLNKVIPNFYEIYKSMNIELPNNCKFLYDINISIKNNPYLTIITITSWGLILLILGKYFSKKLSIELFIKINVVKLFFEYAIVLLLSIITSTGINISTALEYCESSIGFAYLSQKIKGINTDILNGMTLTESLENSKILSKYTLAIIRMREETGTIEEGFKELEGRLERELNWKIKKYLSRISPVFMLIMAGFILIFMLGFVLPLFDNLKYGMR
jgi:type IV pilus assembly protein PilC